MILEERLRIRTHQALTGNALLMEYDCEIGDAFAALSTLKMLLSNLSSWDHHYQFRVLLQHAVSSQKSHGLSKSLGD